MPTPLQLISTDFDGTLHSDFTEPRDLMQFPYVDRPRPAGNEVHFEVEGTEDNAFEVLNLLVNHGYRVVEFRQTKANLEDIFMNVTEGHVQ